MKEIEVPKHLRQFMLEGAQETNLGDKKGAKKQYRYGNLHIREYDDKYTVHMDKYDPRSDPIRHLVWDAPEVLIGLAGAIIGGSKVGSYLYNQKQKYKTIINLFWLDCFFGDRLCIIRCFKKTKGVRSWYL